MGLRERFFGGATFLRGAAGWAAVLVLVFLASCRAEGPEYREPPADSAHGTILVRPATDSGGGGLRSIDGLRAFPPSCPIEEIASWKYREWRASPGMHEVEIFALGSTIRRTVRVREGVRSVFAPQKYVDSETRGADLVMGVYALQEEPLPGKP